MAQWIIVRTSDDRIIGQGQGANAPSADANHNYVPVNDSEKAQLEALRQSLRDDGRKVVITWDEPSRAGIAAADSRPAVTVTLSPAHGMIAADGVDSVTMTLTIDDATPTVTKEAWLCDEFWRLEFVAGIATAIFTTERSGICEIVSTPDVKISNGPVTIKAFKG